MAEPKAPCGSTIEIGTAVAICNKPIHSGSHTDTLLDDTRKITILLVWSDEDGS